MKVPCVLCGRWFNDLDRNILICESCQIDNEGNEEDEDDDEDS
jgi:hypothetical protein